METTETPPAEDLSSGTIGTDSNDHPSGVMSIVRTCPDCGTPGSGNYCSNCGEEMEPRVLRIRHYVRDVFQELLSFDSKFLHSIPALLFKPGFLATEFVAGRRRKYLSPLRLHIIVAILMYLSLGYVFRTRTVPQMDNLNKQHAADSILSAVKKQQVAQGDSTKIPTYSDIKSTVEYIEGMQTEVGPYVLLLSATPTFALLLAILYRKRKKLFVEHLMFSLYFFSFAYLILIPPILWLHNYLFPACGVIFCMYLYFALRKFYDDRGFKLVLRSFMSIFACAFIALSAFGLSYMIAWGIGEVFGGLPSGWPGTITSPKS